MGLTGFLTDCRHAVRLYARTPGASLAAVFFLAVGLAVVGALLSLYVDLVLRPDPTFENSRQIATIAQNAGPDRVVGIAYSSMQQIADEMVSIDAIAGLSGTTALIGSEREDVLTGMASVRFFSGLRPRLALGRGFRSEDHEPTAEPVVVLSYRYWQQQFSGDPNVLGTLVEITRDPGRSYLGPPGSFLLQDAVEPAQESELFRIVGILDRTFTSLASFEPAILIPLERAWPLFMGVPESLPSHLLRTYVRRASGASATAVANELRARYEDSESFGPRIPGSRLDVADGIVGNFAVYRNAKRQLEVFLAGGVLLALTAAANVSLFLLARAPGRRRELGIRMAVGAPLKRLARQLATESALLVIVAAAVGFAFSLWLSVYIRGLPFFREAQWNDVTLLDWRVLSLAGVLVLALSLLVSLAPVAGMRRLRITASIHQTSAQASMPQRLAGLVQFAAAGMLGGAAIAFAWYLSTMLFGDQGFELRNRFMVQSNAQNFAISPDSRTVAVARWREAVEAIPGVSAIAFGHPVPGREQNYQPMRIPHPLDPATEIEAYIGEIEQQFVDVLGLKLLYGRAPNGGEADVLVINQAFARAIWGRDDVVGEPFSIGIRPGNLLSGRPWEIIGVLEDLSFGHPSVPARPYVFRGDAQFFWSVVETRLTAAELRQALQAIESELDIAVHEVRPLQAMREELIAPDRARGLLIIATATLVAMLAAFGCYGMQHYLVSAGRREYAIRASLGAGPRALGNLVLLRAILLGLPGVAAGGLLAFIAVTSIRDDLLSPAISPAVVTFWVVSGLTLLLVVASLGPARGARKTLPASLLRED